MWALPEIVVLMPIIWKVWVKNMMAIFRTALNRELSALLKMSDMVGTVSPQKPRRSKVTEFGTNRKLICDFLLMINTNLAPAPFPRYSIRQVQNRYIRLPLVFNSPDGGFPCDDLHKFFTVRSHVVKVPNGAETLPKISIAWVGRTNVTDDRQTDGRWRIANVNVSSRLLKTEHQFNTLV